MAGAPAERAGLRVGDVVVAVDGQAVASGSELETVITGGSIGQTYLLSVFRETETFTITVVTEGSAKWYGN